MSAKAIFEADGKSLLTKWLPNINYVKNKFAVVVSDFNWEDVLKRNPWISTEKLVVKPDQLIKRRGKLGLIQVNVNGDQAKEWITERNRKGYEGWSCNWTVKRFIIEPFIQHQQNEEVYLCIYAQRDVMSFYFIMKEEWKSEMWTAKVLATFIRDLFQFYTDLYFTYLEINPLEVQIHHPEWGQMK
ncbi:ATP-citrate synthase-like [Montipora capricornis]|uniref:ATP-citrate synthase-like n=1 Tax=Montipora capricornis TaxID=246305 RepID=UPI0035F20AE9